MNTEKIKEIWKENAVKQIDNYTDSEIKSIVLKSARKAINHYYTGSRNLHRKALSKH